MDRAVVFDLYETLITENHPEWYVEAPAPGERLGLDQEDCERKWSARYLKYQMNFLAVEGFVICLRLWMTYTLDEARLKDCG